MNRVFAWPVDQDDESPVPVHYSVYLWIFALLGGLCLGVLLAAAVQVGQTWATSRIGATALVVVVAAAAASQLTGRMGPFPQRRRQVPRDWIHLGMRRASIRFGLALGFGLTTFLHFPIVYAVLAGLFALADWRAALLTGIAFGFVRGAIPMLHRAAIQKPGRAARLEAWAATHARSGLVNATLASVGSAFAVLAIFA